MKLCSVVHWGTIRPFAPTTATHLGSVVQTEVTVTHDWLLIGTHCSVVYTLNSHPGTPTGDGYDVWMDVNTESPHCYQTKKNNISNANIISVVIASPWTNATNDSNQEMILVIKLACWPLVAVKDKLLWKNSLNKINCGIRNIFKLLCTWSLSSSNMSYAESIRRIEIADILRRGASLSGTGVLLWNRLVLSAC